MEYKIEFQFAENVDLEVPKHLLNFIIEADDIEEAVIKLDKYLFKYHLTNSTNDFSDNYENSETECNVSFSDGVKGLSLDYMVKGE